MMRESPGSVTWVTLLAHPLTDREVVRKHQYLRCGAASRAGAAGGSAHWACPPASVRQHPLLSPLHREAHEYGGKLPRMISGEMVVPYSSL